MRILYQEIDYGIGEHVYTPNSRFWEIVDKQWFEHSDGGAYSYVLREVATNKVFGPVYWRLLRREREKPYVKEHEGPRRYEGKPCGRCGSRTRFLTGNCVACTTRRVKAYRGGEKP